MFVILNISHVVVTSNHLLLTTVIFKIKMDNSYSSLEVVVIFEINILVSEFQTSYKQQTFMSDSVLFIMLMQFDLGSSSESGIHETRKQPKCESFKI